MLDGSVQRSNDIVRIATSLTDGKTGFTSWSQSIDRKLSDIFAVQNEIARTVSEALHVRIATNAPAPGGTRNVAAYENFLRGRALFNLAKDEPTDRSALAYLDLAVAADPGFALAHAARSRALAAIAIEYAPAAQLQPLYDAAIAAARRALAIAPELAEANLALAFVLFAGKLDVPAARPFYDKAYARGRGNADIILLYALILLARGARRGRPQRDQPRDRARPAQPAHFSRGRIDRLCGAPLCRSAGTAAPRAGAQSADQQRAVADRQLPAATRPPGRGEKGLCGRAACAVPLHRAGDRRASARQPSRRRSANLPTMRSDLGDSALYQQAEVLAQWGRLDEAIAALEQAHRIGDSGMIYLATDPLLDPLRSLPKFARLIKAMKLA